MHTISEISAVSAEPVPAKAPRYEFVDLLRGFALVVMVETHVCNAYLPLELKKGSEFFFWLAFFNGLVAPAFLFASGFSIVLQSNSQWENWLRFRRSFWKQMRRLGFITLVAYYTHLQGFRFSRYLENWNDQAFWSRSLKVDVLQCIVVSLLVVHVLILLLRKKQLLPWGAIILAVAVALSTPWIWAQDFREKIPLSLALFLNPHGTSLFPIFPWLCFVLAGSGVSGLFLRSVETKNAARFMRNLALFGISMIACGLLLRGVPYSLPGHVNFYTTSPLYMMIRIGCVLIICFLLYRLEIWGKWIPGLVRVAGQESLLVYGVHLWIIFALLRGRLLAPVLPLHLNYFGCFALSAAIIVVMLYLAKYYHAIKVQYPHGVRCAQAVIVTLMIIVFFLS
ncbi:MAG: DUF1624 domain-containing protein [Acidobacteria bacterium]|nr:DUF1624 domain-containing protein [Acidobacteriota bacterium]